MLMIACSGIIGIAPVRDHNSHEGHYGCPKVHNLGYKQTLTYLLIGSFRPNLDF